MTLQEFMRLNKSKGMCWFEYETMKFFKTKVLDWDDDTGYFITSELGPVEGEKRKYTIRKGNLETGAVRTVGGFQEFDTIHEARKEFNKLCGEKLSWVLSET